MYSIRISHRAIKDMAELPKDYSRLVAQHIDGLSKDPRPHDAKKLKSDCGYSLHVGTYRILYDIDVTCKVSRFTVLSIDGKHIVNAIYQL